MEGTAPAIRAAEDILLSAWGVADEEVEDALDKLGTVEGTYGVLWGAGNPRTSGMDLDLYMLKKKAVEFIRELRQHRDFGVVVAIQVGRLNEEG